MTIDPRFVTYQTPFSMTGNTSCNVANCPVCRPAIHVCAPVAQGWECPRCQRINAPTTPTCFCQPGPRILPDAPAGQS